MLTKQLLICKHTTNNNHLLWNTSHPQSYRWSGIPAGRLYPRPTGRGFTRKSGKGNTESYSKSGQEEDYTLSTRYWTSQELKSFSCLTVRLSPPVCQDVFSLTLLGSGGYVWQEIYPVPSKIFPNVLICMIPKPFTHDFNGNDFAIAQLGFIASSAQRVGENLLK